MTSPARVLYITYDGLLEPLGYSQVFQYLNGLSRQGAGRFALISFEKKADWGDKARRERLRQELREAGIAWTPLRYHKRPSAPATLFDVAHGIVRGSWLMLRHRIQIVHARSYVAALIALVLKTAFGARFIFDMRGFWADERVDAGIWPPGSRIYRIVKRLERQYLLRADVIVSLTHAGVREMRAFPYLQSVPREFHVIPTCTNLSIFAPRDRVAQRPFVLGYVGTAQGWYEFAPALECFRHLLAFEPEARMLILNRGEHNYLNDQIRASGLPTERFEIRAAEPREVASAMNEMDATAFFIKPVFSKKASAPTKLGEFLGCGVPCLTNAGVGDLAEYLRKDQTGVVVDDYKRGVPAEAVARLVALARNPATRERCIQAARARFSLEAGIEGYGRIYAGLVR